MPPEGIITNGQTAINTLRDLSTYRGYDIPEALLVHLDELLDAYKEVTNTFIDPEEKE